MDETGVAWWHEPGLPSVYLIVDGGKVTACTPYAEPWALGRTAAQLIERGEREGATVEWIPLSTTPALRPAHLIVGKKPYACWRQDRAPLSETHLTFGRVGDSWFVDDTGEPNAWIFGSATEAWNDCRRRMRTGRWTRIGSRRGTDGRRLGVEADPVLPDGL